jgi:hypothetical protein
MAVWFGRFFRRPVLDLEGNYHNYLCKLRNHRFTVIQNSGGLKVHECYVKYCPCCGEKLDGRKG